MPCLSGLTSLSLDTNRIGALGAALGGASALRALSLSANCLTRLCRSLAACAPGLRELNLSRRVAVSLPPLARACFVVVSAGSAMARSAALQNNRRADKPSPPTTNPPHLAETT